MNITPAMMTNEGSRNPAHKIKGDGAPGLLRARMPQNKPGLSLKAQALARHRAEREQ